MANEELFFNGINGPTGNYLRPLMSSQDLSKIAQGEPWTKTTLRN